MSRLLFLGSLETASEAFNVPDYLVCQKKDEEGEQGCYLHGSAMEKLPVELEVPEGTPDACIAMQTKMTLTVLSGGGGGRDSYELPIGLLLID